MPYALESLGVECFCGSALERVELLACIREIGAGAFFGCGRLRSVVFREGSRLERVGVGAFGGTGLSLGGVGFPAGVEVDEWAFAGP